jgi:hypothetical protein
MAVVRIQLRRDTAANWTSANPVLGAGEMGIETDTDQFKLGDGTTAWASLAYGGIQGPAGTDGVDGTNGTNGTDGVDGGFDSTQTIESGTTRALTSADAGKLITNAGAITITVEGLTTGQQVDFVQTNAAQITFVAGSGVTLNSKDGNLKTNAQYSPASIKCIATDTYVLLGDLGA